MAMITAVKYSRKIVSKHHIIISNNSVASLTKKFFKDFGVNINNINYVKLGFDKEEYLLAFAFLRNKPIKSKPVKFSKAGKTTNSFRVRSISLNMNEDIDGRYCFNLSPQCSKFSKKTYLLLLGNKL